MFTRVYQAENGTVEMYVESGQHKEAMDWARLSTSEIAKELNDTSMEEVFVNPKDAYDKYAIQPEWKPHTLGKRIEQYNPPEITQKKYVRKQPVALSYGIENTKDEPKKTKANYQKRNDKEQSKEAATTTNAVSPEKEIEQPQKPRPTAPVKKWGPPPETITMTATQSEEESTITPSNLPKFGHNKYKVAAAAQDKRMQNIEESMKAMLTLQRETKTEMEKFKTFQGETIETVHSIMEAVEEQGIEAKKSQKETDAKLKQFRSALALFDGMMNNHQGRNESPRRKNPRPTIPPEDNDMNIAEQSDTEDSFASIHSTTTAPKSDDEMTVAAGGN
jgi:hypothetical protein